MTKTYTLESLTYSPDSEGVSTFLEIEYNTISHTMKKSPSKILDLLFQWVSKGHVDRLPQCHPALYTSVKDLTENWTFEELLICYQGGNSRPLPHSFEELRALVHYPISVSLRYTLLRLAVDKVLTSKSVGMTLAYESFIEKHHFGSEPLLWFTPSELGSLFGITESEAISRASRGFSVTKGHYLVRKEIKGDLKNYYPRNLTYLYRPCSLSEKLLDMYGKSSTLNDLANVCDLSPLEIRDIVSDKGNEELNPFDYFAHQGQVEFDACFTYLREYSEIESSLQEELQLNEKVIQSPVNVREHIKTVLKYVINSGSKLSLSDLAFAVDLPVSDMCSYLSEVDQQLLECL